MDPFTLFRFPQTIASTNIRRRLPHWSGRRIRKGGGNRTTRTYRSPLRKQRSPRRNRPHATLFAEKDDSQQQRQQKWRRSQKIRTVRRTGGAETGQPVSSPTRAGKPQDCKEGTETLRRDLLLSSCGLLSERNWDVGARSSQHQHLGCNKTRDYFGTIGTHRELDQWNSTDN